MYVSRATIATAAARMMVWVCMVEVVVIKKDEHEKPVL